MEEKIKQMSKELYHDVKEHVSHRLQDSYEAKKKHNYSKNEFLCEISEVFLDRYNFVTLRDNEKMYIFQENIYQPYGEQFIKQTLHTYMRSVLRVADIKEVIAKVKYSTLEDRGRETESAHFVALENGWYDIEQDELVEPDPSHFLINKLPVTYNRSAHKSSVYEFLADIVPEDALLLLQEFSGYTLYRRYPYQKALMLLGDGGNGKSQYLELLTRMLGEENIATPSLQDLMEDPYAKAELYGKMANIHADLSNRKLESTGTFKMLTGGDMMRGERKYERSFKFYNYAKLLYSTNTLPDTADSTNAFWRRWKTINFPYSFVDQPQGPMEKQKVEDVVDKMCDEEAISTFFNWAVQGLQRLLDQGGFTDSRSEEQMKVMWLAQANPLRVFVDEFVEVDQGSWVSKDDFYTRYVEFCDLVGGSSLAKQNVTKQLNQMIPELRTSRKTSRAVRAYSNIDLLPFDDNKIPNYRGKNTLSCQGSQGFSKTYKRVRGNSFIYRKVTSKPQLPRQQENTTKNDIKTGITELLKTTNQQTTEIDKIINCFNPKLQENVEEVIERMKRDGDIIETQPGEVQLL